MSYNWVPIQGAFAEDATGLIFKGGLNIGTDGQPFPSFGNFICDQSFGGGSISGTITFLNSVETSACDFILYYQPQSRAFITAGLGSVGLCSIRTWAPQSSETMSPQSMLHAAVGNRETLQPNRPYNLKVFVAGSQVTVTLDGVNVIVANLPIPLPSGQAGILCMGAHDIRISDFTVHRERPRAFVVMQFTPPYDELYSDVIRPICEELGLQPIRADETVGPGLIIADMARQIVEAKVIIADITPANRNVYYEVGYAHALNKPTILIAERPTQLPFDVSPFRVLFYENTIAGKTKVEDGLRKYLQAIQTEWLGT